MQRSQRTSPLAGNVVGRRAGHVAAVHPFMESCSIPTLPYGSVTSKSIPYFVRRLARAAGRTMMCGCIVSPGPLFVLLHGPREPLQPPDHSFSHIRSCRTLMESTAAFHPGTPSIHHSLSDISPPVPLTSVQVIFLDLPFNTSPRLFARCTDQQALSSRAQAATRFVDRYSQHRARCSTVPDPTAASLYPLARLYLPQAQNDPAPRSACLRGHNLSTVDRLQSS
nr:hypothetical protein CFP56_02891 [Quercus suber]